MRSWKNASIYQQMALTPNSCNACRNNNHNNIRIKAFSVVALLVLTVLIIITTAAAAGHSLHY